MFSLILGDFQHPHLDEETRAAMEEKTQRVREEEGADAVEWRLFDLSGDAYWMHRTLKAKPGGYSCSAWRVFLGLPNRRVVKDPDLRRAAHKKTAVTQRQRVQVINERRAD